MGPPGRSQGRHGRGYWAGEARMSVKPPTPPHIRPGWGAGQVHGRSNWAAVMTWLL